MKKTTCKMTPYRPGNFMAISCTCVSGEVMVDSKVNVEKLLGRIRMIASPFMKIYSLVIAEDGFEMVVKLPEEEALVNAIKRAERKAITKRMKEMAEEAPVSDFGRVARVLIGRIFQRLNISVAKTYNIQAGHEGVIFDNTPKKVVLDEGEVLQAIAEMHVRADMGGRSVYFNSSNIYAGEGEGFEEIYCDIIYVYESDDELVMKSYFNLCFSLKKILTPIQHLSPHLLKAHNQLTIHLKSQYIRKIYNISLHSSHLLMKTTLLLTTSTLC